MAKAMMAICEAQLLVQATATAVWAAILKIRLPSPKSSLNLPQPVKVVRVRLSGLEFPPYPPPPWSCSSAALKLVVQVVCLRVSVRIVRAGLTACFTLSGCTCTHTCTRTRAHPRELQTRVAGYRGFETGPGTQNEYRVGETHERRSLPNLFKSPQGSKSHKAKDVDLMQLEHRAADSEGQESDITVTTTSTAVMKIPGPCIR